MKIKDTFYYIQGNIRYELFYSRFKNLIPKHIREQITYRINSMEMQCYTEGQCNRCGCKTTALQMCNKPCDKPCYPKMMDKVAWQTAKYFKTYVDESHYTSWVLDIKNLKFIRVWIG